MKLYRVYTYDMNHEYPLIDFDTEEEAVEYCETYGLYYDGFIKYEVVAL